MSACSTSGAPARVPSVLLDISILHGSWLVMSLKPIPMRTRIDLPNIKECAVVALDHIIGVDVCCLIILHQPRLV